MTDSKRTRKNGDNKKIVKQIKPVEILPPDPIELLKQRTSSVSGVSVRSNLPPEITLATLPHISSDERKMLIEEISKENQRMFDAFQLSLKFSDKESKRDKIFLIFIIIFLAFVMFLLLKMGKDEIFNTLLKALLGAFGGSGIILYHIFYKKKNNFKDDE